MMTPRERILAALNHRATDVVPFDIGGTKTTSINVQAYDRLKAYLGTVTAKLAYTALAW